MSYGLIDISKYKESTVFGNDAEKHHIQQDK